MTPRCYDELDSTQVNDGIDVPGSLVCKLWTFSQVATAVVRQYNTAHSLFVGTGVAVTKDKEALYSWTFSSMTELLRFEGAQNADVTKFQSHLVPRGFKVCLWNVSPDDEKQSKLGFTAADGKYKTVLCVHSFRSNQKRHPTQRLGSEQCASDSSALGKTRNSFSGAGKVHRY